MEKSQAGIECCAIFLALRNDETIQDGEPIFALQFLYPSSSKHNFKVPPTQKVPVLFLNYYTPKILIFSFLQMCQKQPKTSKKLKT